MFYIYTMLSIMVRYVGYVLVIWLVNTESELVVLVATKVSMYAFHPVKVTSSRGTVKL